jgi:N-acetylglucosaminyldiphosphoundecaprenol N-acetyl-beta-D-mannosaminyltransferase
MVARKDILGVQVSAINIKMAVETISSWIAQADRIYVCFTAVPGIVESPRSGEVPLVHNGAGMVAPDGMPLVWLQKWARFRHVDRVYGKDPMHAVFGANSNLRHFFYGTIEPTLNALSLQLRKKLPNGQIVGGIAPPFRPLSPAEDEAHVAEINAGCPDIVWVGLSTPKQGRWIATHRNRLNAAVLISVGAAFDIHAGLFVRRRDFCGGRDWNGLSGSTPIRAAYGEGAP